MVVLVHNFNGFQGSILMEPSFPLPFTTNVRVRLDRLKSPLPIIQKTPKVADHLRYSKPMTLVLVFVDSDVLLKSGFQQKAILQSLLTEYLRPILPKTSLAAFIQSKIEVYQTIPNPEKISI